MSDVIIWKLNNIDDSYDKWYDFLNWKEPKDIEEAGTWDDTFYSGNMYKAYKIYEETTLTYILLKWPVIYKGDYDTWKQERRKVEYSIYDEQDLIWMNND
jgi:hypothetical protein